MKMAVVKKYSLPYGKITMKVRKGTLRSENINLLNSDDENGNVEREEIENLI